MYKKSQPVYLVNVGEKWEKQELSVVLTQAGLTHPEDAFLCEKVCTY